MAQLGAVAVKWLPTILSAASSVMGSRSASKSAKGEAAQIRRRAGLTRATSQREAIEERRDARYVMSKARARAAASGAGVSDPTIVDILGDIEGEGEYRSLARLWEGEEMAQGDMSYAYSRQREGRATATAGYLGAASIIFSSDAAQSFFDKYK